MRSLVLDRQAAVRVRVKFFVFVTAMIDVLRNDTVDCMKDTFIEGEYDYVAEGRTFR